MTIHIFGDSFCATSVINHHNKPTWYDILSSYETVKNYGVGASGPYVSFDLFYEKYENDLIKPNDKIVFMLSNPYRIPFTFLKRVEDTPNTRFCFDDYISNFGAYEVGLGYIHNYIDIINQTYQTFDKEIDFYNLKNISFLKCLSELNDWKIIIFQIFDMNKWNVKKRKYPFDEKYNFEHFNNENFLLYHEYLEDLSSDEFEDGYVDNDVDSFRNNHFSEPNHVILANIMTNFFFKTKYTDVKFKKNIYPAGFKKSNSFIYE